ncbi:MAG: DNA repair protein RadC [Sphingorhabdus sp.]
MIDPVSALLSSVQQALIESVRPKVADRKRLSSAADVIEYLIVAMANLPIEVVRVLFLDIQNRLIRDEIVGRGSVSEAPIYPREILKRSLALGATALILAHNHPSGDPEPSEADILATHRLATAGAELGIAVHDHIIVGQAGWVSMRDNEQFQDQG